MGLSHTAILVKFENGCYEVGKDLRTIILQLYHDNFLILNTGDAMVFRESTTQLNNDFTGQVWSKMWRGMYITLERILHRATKKVCKKTKWNNKKFSKKIRNILETFKTFYLSHKTFQSQKKWAKILRKNFRAFRKKLETMKIFWSSYECSKTY